MDDVVDQLFPNPYQLQFSRAHHHFNSISYSQPQQQPYYRPPSRTSTSNDPGPSNGPRAASQSLEIRPNPQSPIDDHQALFQATEQDYALNDAAGETSTADQIQDDTPIDEEPLYVNAKQYFRILKRRVARARLEEVHRLSRQRKVRTLLYFIASDC